MGAGKVVALHGGNVAGHEPVEAVVGMLRGLLERAERGEITSVAAAYVRSDGSVGSGWQGAEGTRFGRAAGVMMLHQRIALDMVEDGN